MQSLANIEAKYAEDFLATGAVGGLPPAIHDMPEMIATKQGSCSKQEQWPYVVVLVVRT